jgi:hypothetical protein
MMTDEKKNRPAELDASEETVRSAGGVPVEVLFGDDGRIQISFLIPGREHVHTFLWDREESLTLLHNFVLSKIPRVVAVEKNNRSETQPLQSEPADGSRRLWGSKIEDEQLSADVAEQLTKDHPPKAGDTVIFPAGHRAKIHSTSEGMAWLANQDGTMSERHIPLGDLVPSGEPNTWMYAGDTVAEN